MLKSIDQFIKSQFGMAKKKVQDQGIANPKEGGVLSVRRSEEG
jgi:hypothetical protein